ncbi:hypothetical protein Tmar_2030 [Thermaerobacter marianensis DSM 12885]|uniref:Membrane protein YkvI n=1 Tax=Thermaerobacter marianensis (strain ATCC 700841 / DSM 12885 / JCM 10246 / 7p75a) TaxID=644966 RepID=E6SJF6_THEM7|nr:hypothetical protein [Thermaerobacter marianensis]ADU52111.1 hypothetical protein Tmar_2030 [Thermaerobacter marianensis DSM 12885]
MAATFIGTVVGAGFASGQEILSFFTLYGWPGTAGILLVAAAFVAGGRWWLEMGARTGASSYRDALQAVAGPWAGSFMDGLLAASLFAGVGVMTAGAAAVTAEQLGWSPWTGRLVFAVLCAATVWRGLPGVLAANAAVVPLLVAAVLVVTVHGLLGAPGPAVPLPRSGLPAFPALAPMAASLPVAPARHWLLAALLYAGFNLLLSLPVLVPLGAAAPPPSRRTGSLVGGTGLAALALLLHLAMLVHMPGPATREIPVFHLAAGLPGWVRAGLGAVLWTEIFTTAVGSLYGLASRAGPPGTCRYRLAVVAVAAAATTVAGAGFAHLVRLLYPLMGWLGLVLMAWLLAAPRR